MKFTLSWLKDHLDDRRRPSPEVADAMTMAGLEVEHVIDPAAKLAAFTVAKIVEAVQHPNADRLRVCQVDTVDGLQGDRLRRAQRAGGPGHHLRPDRRLCARARASPWSRSRCAASSPTACSARRRELEQAAEGRRHPRARRRPAGRNTRRRGARAGPGDRLRGHAQPPRLAGRAPASPATPGRRGPGDPDHDAGRAHPRQGLPVPDRDPRSTATPAPCSPAG